MPTATECVVCTRKATHSLTYDSANGTCRWQVCDPCLASRVAQTWQGGRNYIVDNEPVQDLSAFVATLPKRQKCVTCGSKCNEAHWHFANGDRKARVVAGRAFYCDRQCCDSPHCSPGTVRHSDDEWDDLDWDEDDLMDPEEAAAYLEDLDDEELDWDDDDEAAVVGAAVDEEDDWDF